MLLNELRKIDARKREREKKTQDLQKLITAADNQAEARSGEKKVQKKKVQQARPAKVDTTVIFIIIIYQVIYYSYLKIKFNIYNLNFSHWNQLA